MRHFAIAALAVCVCVLHLQEARSNSLVLAAQAATVDSDGDSVIDLTDNAPGVWNDQADTDADGIGDVIDPTPMLSNPVLGDPGLGVYSAPQINVGGTAVFDYVTTYAIPPGAYGYIELDFDLDNTTDAVFFGPLDVSINTINIPASFFVAPQWDLFTPGMYSVGMKAYAPGMHSENWAYPNVVVVPEPGTLYLIAAGAIALASGRPLSRFTRRR